MQKQELTSVCDYTKLQKYITNGKRQKHTTNLVVHVRHKSLLLFLQCSSIYSVLTHVYLWRIHFDIWQN